MIQKFPGMKLTTMVDHVVCLYTVKPFQFLDKKVQFICSGMVAIEKIKLMKRVDTSYDAVTSSYEV